MVRWLLALLLVACALPFGAFAAKVKVMADVDTARSNELRRIEGRVYIWHQPKQKIDSSSFELEKKPLTATFVRDRAPTATEIVADPNMDADVIVSEYRFQLPGKPKGLYILPSITVTIEGQKFKSVATTYEISSSQASTSLDLDVFVEGDQPFYPGQRTVFGYKIYYNRDIDLTEEQLPLLEAEGFQKVGGKEVKDSQTDSYTVQEIRQEVRALEPGTWTYGPSTIEGATYEEDISGKRKYDKQHLRATVPAMTVKVVPYPVEGRPASFTGALGAHSIKARLLTPAKINIGEQVEVAVRITGPSENSDLAIPDISCQPGYSGFFQISDYPYFEQRDNLSKEFIITLRPLSAHITDVPQMEFAYFDPKKRDYVKVHTDPIALEVLPLVSIKPESRSGHPEEQVEKTGPKEDLSPGLIQSQKDVTGVDWRVWLGKPAEVKLSAVYPLTAADLKTNPWNIRYVWMATGIILLLLLLEGLLKRFRGSRPVAPRVLVSEDYLALAAQAKNDPGRMTSLIEDAFLLLLVEKGWYAKKPRSPEYLTTDGPVGEVRSFLFDMAGKRFGGQQAFVPREVLTSARKLYRTIRYGRG